jgi:hypothetical protein
MKMYRDGLIALFVTLLLGACSQQPVIESLEPQANSWKPLGDALDVVTKNNVSSAKLLLDRNGKLVAVWAEDNGLWYLQAKRWNGTAWETLTLPSKALPYTDLGVNAFDAVFDSTNALVVSQLVIPENWYSSRSGRIEVYRAGSSSWTKLGAFNGLVQLETNASGQVHAVFHNKTLGNNLVRRWDGTNWTTIATLKKNFYESSPPLYLYAMSFMLQTDGKPVIEADNPHGYRSSFFYSRIGNGWQETYRGRYIFDYTLNADNQIISVTSFYASGTELEVTGTGDAGLADGNVSLAVRNNQPLLLYFPRTENNKMTAKLWTGSTWQKLGGSLERDSSKVAYQSNVLIGKNGSVFVVWQEAACSSSATCGGGNIYVSQYIE